MQDNCNFLFSNLYKNYFPLYRNSISCRIKKSSEKSYSPEDSLTVLGISNMLFWGTNILWNKTVIFILYPPPAYFGQFVHSPNFWIIFWYSYNNIHKILHLLIRISCIFITYYLLNLYTVWNAYLTDTFHSLSYI